jgi:hypothetical protein
LEHEEAHAASVDTEAITSGRLSKRNGHLSYRKLLVFQVYDVLTDILLQIKSVQPLVLILKYCYSNIFHADSYAEVPQAWKIFIEMVVHVNLFRPGLMLRRLKLTDYLTRYTSNSYNISVVFHNLGCQYK